MAELQQKRVLPRNGEGCSWAGNLAPSFRNPTRNCLTQKGRLFFFDALLTCSGTSLLKLCLCEACPKNCSATLCRLDRVSVAKCHWRGFRLEDASRLLLIQY